MTTTGLRADLVMEGGGVKGIAFIGALDVLSGAGSTFPRTLFIDTAGTSALDFDIAPAQTEALIDSGREAARRFLETKAPSLWPGL